MDEEERSGKLRIRVSLTPELRRRIDDASAALGVGEPHVVAFALAMGLRFLDVTLVNPVTAQMQAVVDERVNTEAQGAVAAARAAGLPVREG